MKGKWRVTSNPIDGKTLYRVYRLRNVAEVDHSGNREYAGEYVTDRDQAASAADQLNSEIQPDTEAN